MGMRGAIIEFCLIVLLLLSASPMANAQSLVDERRSPIVEALRLAAKAGPSPDISNEDRARLGASLEQLANAFSAYLLAHDYIEQEILGDPASAQAWQRGVYPGTERSVAGWMVERMRRLTGQRDKLAVARLLWRRGGEPMLTLVLDTIAEMRRELPKASTPATAMR